MRLGVWFLKMNYMKVICRCVGKVVFKNWWFFVIKDCFLEYFFLNKGFGMEKWVKEWKGMSLLF